jgi:hypothetical protein
MKNDGKIGLYVCRNIDPIHVHLMEIKKDEENGNSEEKTLRVKKKRVHVRVMIDGRLWI